MIDIEWIQSCVKKNEYYFSKHSDQERQNDNLTVAEVEEVILNGKILEQYENSGRGNSCLVVGFTSTGKPVHSVCARRGDWMVIVTVYIPRPPKFKTVFERGT